MLLRNKRAACLRREFSRFLRLCSLLPCGFLLLTAAGTAAPGWPQAAAAAMLSVPPRKSTEGRVETRNCQIPFTRRETALRPPQLSLVQTGVRNDVCCQSHAVNYRNI